MPEVTKDMLIKIAQQGAEDVRRALEAIANAQRDSGTAADAAGAAQKRHGAETSKVTQFVREQRSEQRQQAFLFRETKDAIGSVTFGFMALSGAMGSASETNRKLNQTLVTGYSAFQAADFAMAGLGLATGGTALAIAGLVGGGAAFLSFLDNSAEKAKEAAKQMAGFSEIAKNYAEGIGGKEAKREKELLDIVIGKTDANIKALKTIQGVTGGAGFERIGKEVLEFLGISKDQTGDAIKQQEGLATAYKLRRSALIDLIAAEEQLSEVERRKKAVEADALRSRLNPYFEAAGRAGGISPLAVNTAGDLVNTLRPGYGKKLKGINLKDDLEGMSKIGKEIGKEMDATNAKELLFLGLLDEGVGTLRSTASFLGAETDSFIGKLLQGLDIAMSIAKTIQAISSIGSVVSALFGNPVGLGTRVAETVGGTVGSSGPGTTIVINAVDAKSFSRMLEQPEHRQALVNAVDNVGRLGR